jgi:nucleotide-binding universal stress UspA family protein
MVTINIPIPETYLKKLEERAKSLGITPQELARIGIEEVLRSPDPKILEILEQIIEEDDELLRRLA